jgi:hypothetical protein
MTSKITLHSPDTEYIHPDPERAASSWGMGTMDAAQILNDM